MSSSDAGVEEDGEARERQGGGPTWLPGPDVAWGPTTNRAPAVCGEGGLITQRFYAPAPAPPAVSDAATIMPKPNERMANDGWSISGTITGAPRGPAFPSDI